VVAPKQEGGWERFGVPLPGSAQEGLLSAIVTGSPPAIMVGALNGVMLFWNPAAELLFGWSADEVVGHQLLDVEFNLPADSHRARTAVAAGDDVLEVEVRRRHRQGHMIRAIMSTVGLRDPSGQVTALLGIFREVPERKAAEGERLS
jgi:PAS domain S-box-containing protein